MSFKTMAVNDSLFNMDVVIFRWIGLVKSEPKSLSRDVFATLKIMAVTFPEI